MPENSNQYTIEKAIIMAGGFGTRLRPLTMNLPKPLVPMMQRPMMHHIANLLKKYGVKEITSMLYYQPESIREYFGDGKKFGYKMHYILSDADYGTAGSVRNAYDFVDGRFVVISGDVLTDFDLSKAIEFHVKKGALATMVLTHVKNPLQFGVVITDKDGKITRFLEKPTWGEVFSDTINTGIYILEKEVMDLIPYKEDYDFSKDLFPKMLKEDMPLYGFIADGYWRDVGTLTEYQEAHIDCLNDKVNLDFAYDYEEVAEGVYAHKSAKIDLNSVKFGGKVYIGKECSIEKNCVIEDSVIGDGSTIGEGTRLKKSVLWHNSKVGNGSDIYLSVMTDEVEVGESAKIEEQTFIADKCKIGKEANIRSGVKLWPEKEIESGAIVTKSLVWESKWSRELFTGSRVTGISNIEIGPDFAAKLGASFGSILGPNSTVLVSRDVDKSSRMINRAIIAGMLSAGVSVSDLQIVPIAIARHRLKNGSEVGGIHIRKSPFNQKMLDIIFLDKDGKDIPNAKTKTIERNFFGEDYKRADFENIGTISFPERAIEGYTEDFLSQIDTDIIKKARLRVAIDYAHGAATTISPSILGELGVDVVSLNAFIDPKKGTRTADEFYEASDRLSEVVVSLGCDIGFMMDAGAERVFVSDEKGTFLENQRLLTIVTRLFLDVNPETKKIVLPITASQEVEELCKERNVQVIRTGDSHLDMMRAVTSDPEIAFAGGTKAGFIFPGFLFACDAMFSTVKILELIAKTSTRIGDLNLKYPQRYFLVKRNVPCPKDLKGKVMRKIMEETNDNERVLIDGVKVIYDDDTSLLLLPDRARDIFHVDAESKSKSRATMLVAEFEQKLNAWIRE